MRRFDVHPAPGPDGRFHVLDVQADLLRDLDTRVVVPLLPPAFAPRPPVNDDPGVVRQA